MIYLDNNATTRIAPAVKAAMLPYLDDEFGNPSSQSAIGARAKEALLRSRLAISDFVKASPTEIVFTSGATESNHAAIFGAIEHFSGKRNRIVTTAVEHPATLRLLQSRKEVEVVLLSVDRQGRLDPAQIDAAITTNTALVSVMWANNETGVVFPVEEIARIAKQRGALFHTDAVQAIGRLPLNFRDSSIDLLSFSGHKLHAPKGIGGLLVKKGLMLPPFIIGSQERGRRGGTENVMGIAALGEAIALPSENGEIETLRNLLEELVLSGLSDCTVNGTASPRIGNTSSITFSGIDGEELLMAIEKEGIIASQSAACQSGGRKPSHVLIAMGLQEGEAKATLRFSLSRYNRREEVEEAARIIVSAARRARARNPFA